MVKQNVYFSMYSDTVIIYFLIMPLLGRGIINKSVLALGSASSCRNKAKTNYGNQGRP